jgi:hypothetical protein
MEFVGGVYYYYIFCFYFSFCVTKEFRTGGLLAGLDVVRWKILSLAWVRH